MTERVIIAGSGGQGIMLLGKVLAQGAMREDKFVTWLPSYGAEVRGGTAHCMVVISDKEIGSPYIDKADTLIIMNSPSLAKFKNRIRPKGLLIMNSSLAPRPKDKNARVLTHPFTERALKLGNIKVANMLALGAYLANKKITTLKNIFLVFEEITPANKKNLIEINKEALENGFKLKK